MFSTWKVQLQSLTKPQNNQHTDEIEDPQVLRLRRMLADLRGGSVTGTIDAPELAVATDIAPESPEATVETVEAAVNSGIEARTVEAATELNDEDVTEGLLLDEIDDTLSRAQRFVEDQRLAAEALLREVRALEVRIEAEATAAQAERDAAFARAQAAEAAAFEEQATEIVRNLAERRIALAAERHDCDSLLTTIRDESERARLRITELEKELQKAQRRSVQISSKLEEHEARAQESAALEEQLAREESEAAQRLAACQVACVAAAKEARGAKDRAEALRSDLASPDQPFAGIEQVQSIAARIAEVRKPLFAAE